jgi:hypothetical protein
MKHEGKGPSDWLVERLVLGELDATAAEDVRRRLAAEGRSVEDAIARIAASNQEIMEQHPPLATVAAIRRRAATATAAPARARRSLFVWAAPFALAGAAAVLLVARPWGGGAGIDQVPANPLDDFRIKGDLVLDVYRHGATGDERLRDGARAARGDLLQLSYAARKGGHGVLLSIDGARKVTLHLPETDNGKSAKLRDGRIVRAPSAYQLDDAPGFERFFFVSAPESFDLAPILAAARALAERGDARRQPLRLPAGFEQVSFAVDKTPPSKKDTR